MALLLAIEAILEAPPLATARGDFKIQALSIEQAGRFRAWLGVFDLGVCQDIWGNSFGCLPVAPRAAPSDVRLYRGPVRLKWIKRQEKASSYAGSWTVLDVVGLMNGGAATTE